MARFALIKIADSSILKEAESDREFPGGAPDLSHKGFKWLPIEETPLDPTFDPATQVILPRLDTVEATRVHRTHPIRDKTAQELDQDKEDSVTRQDAKLLFEINFDQENRIRALESKPSITKAQYRNALKAVL